MLEKIFQTIMRRYFGQFLTGLENIELAFWSGKVNLNNVSLKHDKINQLLKSKNIPFTVKYSYIGSLQIDIPWKSLSSTPVEIKISDVYIVLRMEKFTSVSKKIQEEKLMLIKSYVEHLIKKIIEEGGKGGDKPEGQQDGYMKKTIIKIVNNLNAQIRNISVRIICGDQNTTVMASKKDLKGDYQVQQQQQSAPKIMKEIDQLQPPSDSFISIKSELEPSAFQLQSERRPSQTPSQFARRNQKSFSFGFCIEQFMLLTVDQNFNKTFYNLEVKNSAVRKVITMKQISFYLQEQSVFNLFRVNQNDKNQFMKNIILRDKHRLLTIDGRIVMDRNAKHKDKPQIKQEHEADNHLLFDYAFTMNLQLLEIGCTYGQLKQIIKIATNFSQASESKDIKRLSELDDLKQQQLKPQFISYFPQLQLRNFEISTIDAKFGQLLCSVSKKNLLSWTKQCAVEDIKAKKKEMIKKEKNKKGWLSYLVSQAEVNLTEQQIIQAEKQVEALINSLQITKKTSVKFELTLDKVLLLLSHEQLQEYLSFQLQNTLVSYSSTEMIPLQLALTIQSMALKYENMKQKINSLLLSRGFTEFNRNILQFQFKRDSKHNLVSLAVTEIEVNHESRVLILISELMKLKTKQEMKSDIKLKKAQLAQTRDIGQQLNINYIIDVKINKIIFRIEVTQTSYLAISLESIQIRTSEDETHHVGALNNLNIVYSIQKRALEKEHNNNILKDFTIAFIISQNFNKINTKMTSLEIIICETDLHQIYRSLVKQASGFKADKVEYKNKRIHEYAQMKGKLKLLNLMKNWKEYDAILNDDGLYFFEEQILDSFQSHEVSQEHTHMIPLVNCKISKHSQEQFKIQSDSINELVECSPFQLDSWLQSLQKIVFDNSSKANMYKLIDDGKVNNQISMENKKYQTEVKFEFEKIQVLISENRQKSLMKIMGREFLIVLSENQLQFERLIVLKQVTIKRLESGNTQTQLNYLLKTRKQKQFHPIQVTVKGKKKLHPQYRGELELSVKVPYLKLNYDPEFLYKMIKKIAWGHEVPSYTNQMRNTKVLEIIRNYLRSNTYQKRESQLERENCTLLEQFEKYREIEIYRENGHTCNVLMAINVAVSELELTLLNGANNLCAFVAEGKNFNVKIDKGSQFLFFKLTAQDLALYDVTGYPYTNTRPFKLMQRYPILYRKSKCDSKQAVECNFSRFDLDRFINRSRFRNFFYLDFYDVHFNFHNQLLNRFFDYLFNQIVGFIMAPNSLHRYDGPRRGQFLYEYNQNFTQKEIRDIVNDCLQPFFTKMFINVYNLEVTFSSFPKQEGIELELDALKIESFNYLKSQRIRFNSAELTKMEKHPVYKQLLLMPGFQEKLLKNHWVSRLDINAQGIKSKIFSTEVPVISTFVERLINQQKQLLFPFISLDKSLICESITKNMSVRAPKQIYNLINKCIMHNLSYDDCQDNNYTHNSQFRDYMKVSQIFYRLKAESMEILVPELKAVILIPQFQYKFVRHPTLIKKMIVEGKSINIFKGSEIVMMNSEIKDKSNTDVNGLYYRIEMKPSGDKPMEVKLFYLDILYDLKFFIAFGQYTILDQSCYPPLPPGTVINHLPDLPLITCKVELDNSRIKLAVPDSQDQFILSGYISLVWIRNSITHPQKYATNPDNFPNGKEWCSYRIEVKDLTIKKHYMMGSSMNSGDVRISTYNAPTHRGRYRSLSNKISLIVKISQLMKLATNKKDRYNDSTYEVKIGQLSLKLCYGDMEQLRKVFASKEDEQQKYQEMQRATKSKQNEMLMIEQSESQVLQQQQNSQAEQPLQPAPPAVSSSHLSKSQLLPPAFTPMTKYAISIHKIQLQMGITELPVPLFDFVLRDTRSDVEMFGSNANIELKGVISANCWNMLIGRWEPVIEELSPQLSFRFGKDKYLLLDCKRMLLLNISLEALKIFKLLTQDFKQKGNFSILQVWSGESNSDKKVRGMNVSPYVLTNRTGLTLLVSVQNSQSKTKLKPEQKCYIDLKNYELDYSQKLKVILEFETSPNKFDVYMDMAASKRISVQFKNRTYELVLKPISNSIMKEIVVSSLFVVENRTRYAMAFYYNCGQDEIGDDVYKGRVKMMPKERTALRFTANIKSLNSKGYNKNLKLEFPELQKQIEQNCQFPFDALKNDYEHRIDLSNNKSFNCIVSIHEQLENTIIVQPTFHVKNLLPVDVHIEFVVERNGQKLIVPVKLDVNEEKDMYEFNCKQKMQARLKIKGFNISPFQNLLQEDPNKEEYKNYLNLIDYRGHAGKISIRMTKKNKVRHLYIFSEAILINETKFELYTFNGSKLISGQLIPDVPQSQSNYTFLNDMNNQALNFGFSDDNPFNSNEIKISELGVHNLSMYKNDLLHEFTVKINFHCIQNSALIYSYVLKLEPKYVIVNETTFSIEVTQVDAYDRGVMVAAGERLNWAWPMRTLTKYICFRIVPNFEHPNQWLFSSPIAITNQDLQETVFVLRPKIRSSERKLLKLIPIKQNQSTYVMIEEVQKPEDYLITISNELDYCKLRAYQEQINTQNPDWIQYKYFEVGPKSVVPFGWDYQSQTISQNRNETIVVEIAFLGYLRSKFEPQNIKINLEQQKVQQVIITNEDGESQSLNVKIEIIGLRKKIIFCKKEGFDEEDSELQQMQVGNRFAFSFTQIGVSIISSVKKRSQLLFLNLKKVEIITMEKKYSRSLQVKVKYINIDNNSNHNTIYPILLTPLKHEKTLKKSRPFFVLLLQQTLENKDITQIKQFRICTEPLSIKIHDQVLTAVLDMVQEINKDTDKSEGKIDLSAIFNSNTDQMEWQVAKIVKPQRDIFFREFEIAKLALEITFSIRPKLNSNNFIIMTILSSFGAAISNVSEAQLQLSRFLKKDKGLSQLKTELTDFYFKQFMKGLYKVLGSINLFGNPYVFIRMISEGAWEIVNQPTEGFIKGPIQGGIGIIKGGVYFTRNVVAGTCNSFEAISESISRGVSYLTMDQKFIERREKIKIQKSNHFFKGLQYGAFSIYTGVEVAITGLVRHPAQGYAAHGFLGGVTGTLKGFAGLLTKPVSGTFEGISKISEGIKNTALMFQDGPNSKRSRPPRIFFSELFYYKNYNIFESTAISILQFHSTKYLNEIINYISLIDSENKKLTYAYIFTQKYFCNVEIINRKLLREIEISNIKQLKIEEQTLHIVAGRQEIVIEAANYEELFQAFHKFYFNDI